jgi:hypothetical protein
MRFRPRRALELALPLALVAAGASCKESLPPDPPQTPAATAKPAASAAPKAPPGPALLPSRLVAELDDENATPFYARSGKQGLVIFSAKGRLVSQVVGVDGDPTGIAPVDLGAAPRETTMGALRAVGDGWVFAWAEPAEKNHAVKVLALDKAGKPRGPAAFAAQISDDLGWLDVLPNAKGALVFWEVRKDDRAELSVAPLVDGKPGAPSVVVKDALGWETVATERGAVIAAVMPAGPTPAASRKAKAVPAEDARGKLGRVQLFELDTAGKPGAPIAVTTEPTAQIDVDIVDVEGRYVVAWTDERDIDATVYLAGVDPGGKIAVPPHRATAPAGEQVLVALVGQTAAGAGKAKRALFAWEDLLRQPGEGRLIHLAAVTKDAQVGVDRATLAFASSGPPDLALDGDGFAAMTLAPVPVPAPAAGDHDAGHDKEHAVWPVYVRFAADLSVVASEPVRAAPFASTDGVPYLTRALSCFEGTCTTLASGAGAKAPLAFVSLEKRPSDWRAAASKDKDSDKPRATSVTAIYDGDHLADVSATEVPGGGGNALAAWVTYYLDGTIGMAAPGKKGKKAQAAEDPFSATVAVRSVSPKGELGPVNVLSRHGVSFGGVSIAGAPGGKRPEAAVAWVAKAKGEPQVFVTKLGANGEKLEEKGVTVVKRKKKDKDGLGIPSECSDVAIAWSGGDVNEGWIVAWVDTRDGNAEVYVAKMDRTLKKIVPDRRITEAPGDASDVQIAVRGKETFLIWSDARNHPDQGRGDVYLARLETQTLKRIGEDQRLFASEAHSRSPLLAATPAGLAAAWIEEPLDLGPKGKASDAEAGVRFAELDERGALKGSPVLLRGDARSAATSVTLTCSPKFCRGAITSAIGESLLLGGFQMAPGQPPGSVRTLATLQGGVTEDASPVFASPSAEWLFFADDAVGGAGRLRWMSVAW